MEENEKIAKIKKSCSVGKKISSVFAVIAIVGCICTLVASIAIFQMGKRFDDKVQDGIERGVISEDDEFGSVKLFNFNVKKIEKIHSDIPAVQEALNDHPYSITYGIYCLVISIACAGTAVLLKLVSGAFELIIKENTPFTDKVIKRVLIVMIVISAILLLTTSTGFGILGGITTWVVYTIMDYGKTLQIQSDETL